MIYQCSPSRHLARARLLSVTKSTAAFAAFTCPSTRKDPASPRSKRGAAYGA